MLLPNSSIQFTEVKLIVFANRWVEQMDFTRKTLPKSTRRYEQSLHEESYVNSYNWVLTLVPKLVILGIDWRLALC